MPPNAPLPTPGGPELYGHDLDEREIRVALICNGKWQDPISCVFEYTKIESDATQSYSALSYVWGSPRATETIQIDGHDHTISVNLACAIRHLREERNSVLIWIDALCINQCDIGERSSQVAMMRDIYASAQHVIVFLGHGSYHRIPKNYATKCLLAPIQFSNDGQDDSLITLFRNSWETMCRQAKWYSFCTICVIRALSDIDRYRTTIKCIAEGKASSRLKLFELVRRFINSQWWQRVWVIQEATVTSQISVQYGNVKVPWEVLARSANTCDSLGWGRQDTGSQLFLGIEREHAKVLPVLSKQIFEIERLRMEWADGKATTLLSLLQQFSSRKATDDRDKVFALLGLARDIKKIEPNYSLSTVQVYRSTVIDLIKHSGSLIALSGDMKKKNSGGIPSWIPDWSVAMEEPDRRRMQLDGTYKSFPRWRIALIDHENEYWETVTTDMHSLYEEIESGKRRPIPKEIVDGLICYEGILTTIYESAPKNMKSLDHPKAQAIRHYKLLYSQFEKDAPKFWSGTSIETLVGAYLSLPLTPSSGEWYRLKILRCCSMIYCRRALEFWLQKVQYLETERYKSNSLLLSDQEKEEIVAQNCKYPTMQTFTDAAGEWIENMRRTFYTMIEHITGKVFVEICRSRSIMLETLRSLTLQATVALGKDSIMDVSTTFNYYQGIPPIEALLTQLSHLMHLASGVLKLWTLPDGFRGMQQARNTCKKLINLHRNQDLSTTDNDYAALFSKAVVFTGSATCMRHLRDNGEPKLWLYNKHFVDFRSQKQDEVLRLRESEDTFAISSKCIATVDQCTERLLTWVDSASRFSTISQWALCAQNLKGPDYATSFVRALVGDIYEESPGKFRLLRQSDIRLLHNWFVSCLLPELCDIIMNPAVHGDFWTRLPSTEAELDDMKLFDSEMRITTEGRVFFITKDRRMGFGPGSMAVGDEIRILPGGNSPFVLRPVGRIGINSEPSYEVIGDCFFLLDSQEMDDGEDGLLQGCLPLEILGEFLPTGYRSNDILLL